MIFIGIDPGATGGLALIGDNHPSQLAKLPTDTVAIRDTILSIVNSLDTSNILIGIEQQIPRPTYFNGRSSILKSTCLLYGNYCFLQGVLVSEYLPFVEIHPRTWQKVYSMKKAKGEKDHRWKKRLKEKAQHLYPYAQVTQQTADALLIAHYLKLKHTNEQ